MASSFEGSSGMSGSCCSSLARSCKNRGLLMSCPRFLLIVDLIGQVILAHGLFKDCWIVRWLEIAKPPHIQDPLHLFPQFIGERLRICAHGQCMKTHRRAWITGDLLEMHTGDDRKGDEHI